MKEVWVKKTIYRRHKILDEDIEKVKSLLKGDEYSYGVFHDCFCKNEDLEYDDEQVILPVIYEINDIG